MWEIKFPQCISSLNVWYCPAAPVSRFGWQVWVLPHRSVAALLRRVGTAQLLQCSWHGWQLCYRSVLNQLHELKSGTELLSHAQFQSFWCLCSWSLHEEWVSHVRQECVHWGSVPCSKDKAFDSAKHYVQVVPAILFLLQAQQLCISSWPCIQLSPVTSQVHPLLRRSSFLMDPTIIKELIGKNPDVCSSVISCTCIVLSWMFLCVHLSPLSSFSISVCLFPLLLLSTFAS